MTEYQLESALKEVAQDATENSFEVQGELSAYDHIEDARLVQHANATVAAAANALADALITRRRIANMQEHMDTLHATIKGLTERIEEYDEKDDEVIRLQLVEDDHRHNSTVVNRMRQELATLLNTSNGMRQPRRYVEAPQFKGGSPS